MEQNQAGLFEKTIDGERYEFSKWGAKQSLRMLLRISKIVGEPLALGLGSLTGGKDKGKVLDKEIKPELLGMIAKSLFTSMEEDVVMELIENFAATSAMCNGKKILFDKHYEGRLDHLMKVVAAALEVQYGNFFGALLELQGAPLAGIRNQDTTPAPTI